MNDGLPPAAHEQPAAGSTDRPTTTALVTRGVRRMLATHGHGVLTEVTLKTGRRADVFSVDDKGGITIVEIKSSIEDYKADQKWPDYIPFCDRFFFGIGTDFPIDHLPDGPGIIIADGFGGDIFRPAPNSPVAAARRRVLLIRFSILAGRRLHRLEDADFELHN